MSRYGLPDEEFIRGQVPMTKSEIRALSLVRLELDNNDIIWDIGAGTGSISIEAAMNVPLGKVFAIEKNPNGIELIKANRDKFQCNNLEVVEGSAPQIFSELPIPNKVIIGGSGGNLTEILDYLWKNTSSLKIVINAVTLNTVFLTIEYLNKLHAKNLRAHQIAVTKINLVKNHQMLEGQNPVFIISAEK